ncbi:ExeM/NucH family extracellular endonuclease [Nocardioides sp. Leaf285]|uniref:ExeM/NucH family extracellular endonuclease n=1 Tax=Nocardioides sp. Leaf285 TaxID=1736322 RepID=UPI0009E8CCCF|nr:ExeM/NucH family extracellular endonuclease [Nocardioides sp. Leaf285]
MPLSPRATRRVALPVAGAFSLAAVVTGLAGAPALAAPDGSGLVISEVYGGGGNTGAAFTHDFIELYNPTASAISVTGMSVQYRSATGTSAQVTPLSGSVPAGGHYLVQQAAGTTPAAALPTPDATGTIAMSGSNGVVLLASSETPVSTTGELAGAAGVLDAVGYGITPTSFEERNTGVALTNSTSAARTATGTDSDDNADDFVEGTPVPQSSGGAGEPEPEPDPVEATIPEIQGTGAASPLDGDPVTTSGVVTAAPRFLYGFYLQTPGTGGSVDPASRTSSDGVFVYYPNGAGSVGVEPGDHVEVTGDVDEYAGQTQVVSSAAETTVLDTPAAPVTATTTTAWPATAAEKEALEGMLYDPTDDFTVTNTFSTHQFGEVGLALGDKPLIQPTEVADAQDTAAIRAVEADNAARAIVLDDASGTTYAPGTNGKTLTPPYLSNTAPVRVGAAATFTDDVILTQGGSPSAPTYRFQPLQTVSGPDYTATSPATFENTRTDAPDEARIEADGESDLKVASFNVLNYFTTLGDADDDNVGDGGCTTFPDKDGDGNSVGGGCEQRGAWDPQDLARQQAKIVSAINALDADVVGLMEIENSLVVDGDADEATETLVAALNADAGAGTWAANPSSTELPPAAEMDVISNAIIYKPAAVERTGEARALGALSGSGEAFDNAREPIAQAFTPKGGDQPFLFVVNHFKSKGSGADDGTGQGNANPDRVAQATALRDWVPGVQQESGAEGVLLVGDFNSYSQEDPLQVLYQAGYTNIEDGEGADAEYSYSFSGLSGSLDHVLANDAALEAMTGHDIWNINSGESIYMEYSRYNYSPTDFHTDGPFRSSDHDPVVMGLDLVEDVVEPPAAEPALTVSSTPKKVKAGKTKVTLRVKVTADGEPARGGTVTVRLPGGETRTATTNRQGVATIRLAPFDRVGTKTLQVEWSKNGTTVGGTSTIKVVK